MRREQQTLVGGVNREQLCQALPGSARDEERAAKLVGGVNREQLCQGVQGMRREQQTLVGGVNREQALPESARD